MGNLWSRIVGKSPPPQSICEDFVAEDGNLCLHCGENKESHSLEALQRPNVSLKNII